MAKEENPTVVHLVLRQFEGVSEKGERVNERPIVSREHDDPNAEDDIQAHKLDALSKAIASGAARPHFRVAVELGGFEQESLAEAVRIAETNKAKSKKLEAV